MVRILSSALEAELHFYCVSGQRAHFYIYYVHHSAMNKSDKTLMLTKNVWLFHILSIL